MGPSGSGAPNSNPIYVYKQNFDGTSYSVGSEWGYLNAGVSAQTGYFVSASKSMYINGAPWANTTGGAFTQAGVVTFTAAMGDLYCDLYFGTFGSALSNAEFVLVNGTTALADLGYQSGSPATFYAYNGSTAYTLSNVASVPNFHHLRMVYHQATLLSDYWIDDLMVGQGFAPTKTISVAGAPGTWVGFYFPNGLQGLTETFYVDNVSVFHY